MKAWLKKLVGRRGGGRAQHEPITAESAPGRSESGLHSADAREAAMDALGIPRTAPPSLTTHLDLGALAPEIKLADRPLLLRQEGETVELESGRVYFSVSPGPAIRFEGQTRTLPPNAIQLAFSDWVPKTVEITDCGMLGPVHAETVNVGGDLAREGILRVKGELRRLSDRGGVPLAAVVFHVLNFRDYIGSWIDRDGARSRGRLLLEADGWRVTLDQRPNLQQLKDALRLEGGFAFTHIGKLERADAQPFTSAQAEDVLAGLHWFLSFVRGAWVSPILFFGHDSADVVRWRAWDAGRVSRWSGNASWCDPFHWSTAQQAFKTFAAEWRDPFGQAVMKTAIGQYVSANTPNPVEVAIMVSQSGLELLGWAEFVETGMVREDDWTRRMNASEKIGRLLDLCSMNRDIPPSLSALVGLDSNWRTGPDVVAGVRNRLVHPRRKNGAVSWRPQVLVEAWMLVSHYLEWVLLRRLSVSGEIRNRLNQDAWAGTVETPPWASP